MVEVLPPPPPPGVVVVVDPARVVPLCEVEALEEMLLEVAVLARMFPELLALDEGESAEEPLTVEDELGEA